MTPPTKRLGIKEIARIANVSRGTVDRALHGREGISEKARQRILSIAQERGYKPNLAARTLVVGKAALSIGVCIPREIHFFFDQVRDGIMEEARHYESVGITLDYRPIQRFGMGEREKIREILTGGIKALIMAPGDPRLLATLIDDVEKQRIHVVCVATDAPGTPRSTGICSDPELNGRCAGELMGKFLPREARVAVMTGILRVSNHQREVQGFAEAFAHFSLGGQIVDILEDHEHEEEAFKKCRALLRNAKRLDGIYVSTANCLPVCAALQAAGVTEKVKLITTDLFPQMVPWFERGTILASIHQRPYLQGQTAVRLIVDNLVNGLPFPPTRYLSPIPVLRSNLDSYREITRTEIT